MQYLPYLLLAGESDNTHDQVPGAPKHDVVEILVLC
jgi:hypothetical protein